MYCLNCIRCMQNSTFETGPRHKYYASDISTLFPAHCQSKVNYLQVCSDLCEKEKGSIDIINVTGRGKYGTLFLQTSRFCV